MKGVESVRVQFATDGGSNLARQFEAIKRRDTNSAPRPQARFEVALLLGRYA